MNAENAIALLGWLPASQRLNTSLHRAFEGARRAGAKEVRIEHLMAALLEDVDAATYLATRGVEPKFVRDHCFQVIGEAGMPPAPLATAAGPQPQPQPQRQGGAPSVSHAPGQMRAGAPAPVQMTQSEPPAGPRPLSTGPAAPSPTPAPQRSPGSLSFEPTRTAAPAPGPRPISLDMAGHPAPRSAPAPSHTAPATAPSAAPAPAPGALGYAPAPRPALDRAAYDRSPYERAPYDRAAHERPPAAPQPQPAPVAARPAPTPHPALRRLIARTCELAERLERAEIDGELVLRAASLDDGTDIGRLLQRLLPAKDLAKERALAAPKPAAPTAPSQEPAGKAEKAPKPKLPADPAFATLLKSADALVSAIQTALQDNVRYRLANDLRAYIAERDPATVDGAALGAAANPILRAARDDLLRDPEYRAFETARATLREVKRQQFLLCRAIDALVAEQDLIAEPAKTDTPLLTAARRLVSAAEMSEARHADLDDHAMGGGLPAPADAEPERLEIQTVLAPAEGSEGRLGDLTLQDRPVNAEPSRASGFDLRNMFHRPKKDQPAY